MDSRDSLSCLNHGIWRVLCNLQARYWFAAIVVGISGCMSGSDSPTSGKISLEFVGISDSYLR